MLSTIAGFFLKFFTGSTLSFVSGIVTQLTNEHAAIVTAQTTLTGVEVSSVVNAEISRYSAQASLETAMLAHKIWWVGWSCFVLPAGLYVALIHAKSILCPFWETACSWNIPEIPHQLEMWDGLVVMSFFGIAGVSAVVQAIAGKITLPK